MPQYTHITVKQEFYDEMQKLAEASSRTVPKLIEFLVEQYKERIKNTKLREIFL